MVDIEDLKQQLTNLLTNAAKCLNLNSFTINLDLSAQKGDGLLGEFYRTSITNNENGATTHLVIKTAPTDELRRKQTCIETAYRNEIFFYSEIIPAFNQLQRKYAVNLWNFVPPYITSNKQTGREMIVFEDMTRLGYQMREKDMMLDEEHARFIFKTYGRFHALSFCLRDQDKARYSELTKFSFNVVAAELANKAGFSYSLTKIIEKGSQALDLIADKHIVDKFKKYVDNTMDMFKKGLQYEGHYPTILHGDCWSNNMMFKYSEDSKLIGITLLDFQLMWVGSLVCDLSYFFYCGGSKPMYDKLEDYLDIYYKSFSSFARELGCAEERIIPRVVLTEEWKKYSKFGMLWAILLTKSKLISKEDMVNVAESFGGGEGEIDNGSVMFVTVKCDEKTFNERVRDILLHMYEIDAL